MVNMVKPVAGSDQTVQEESQDSSSSKSSQKKKNKPSSRNSSSIRSSSSVEKKKIPPIKAPVGIAPPPQVKNVKAKVGSLDNSKHKPGGGDKKIFDQKNYYKDVHSKKNSKENIDHQAGVDANEVSAAKQSILSKSSKSKEAKRSSASVANQRGDKKTKTEDSEKGMKSKVGSLDNGKHKIRGGHKTNFDKNMTSEKAESTVKTKNNMKNKQESGTAKNFTEDHSTSQGGSEENPESRKTMSSSRSSSQEKRVPPIKAPVGKAPPPRIKKVKSKVGSLDNAKHKPGGGDKKILDQKEYYKNVHSKAGSNEKIDSKASEDTAETSSEKQSTSSKSSKSLRAKVSTPNNSSKDAKSSSRSSVSSARSSLSQLKWKQ